MYQKALVGVHHQTFLALLLTSWKKWVTVYSAVCLKDQLPKHHFQCWLLFVRACSILVKHTILKHCKSFQNLYGAQHCTINLHLHLQLFWIMAKFMDFGAFPLNALGDYFTNNSNIKMQFMKKI